MPKRRTPHLPPKTCDGLELETCGMVADGNGNGERKCSCGTTTSKLCAKAHQDEVLYTNRDDPDAMMFGLSEVVGLEGPGPDLARQAEVPRGVALSGFARLVKLAFSRPFFTAWYSRRSDGFERSCCCSGCAGSMARIVPPDAGMRISITISHSMS